MVPSVAKSTAVLEGQRRDPPHGLRRWLLSAAIVLYLAYALATGIPGQWHIVPDVGVFPWRRWGMFSTIPPYHTELLATGLTATGASRQLATRSFFPATNRWALEGNRAKWAIRNESPRTPIMHSLCSWMLTRHNGSTLNPDERLVSLELTVAYWPLETDSTLPPARTKSVATCNAPPEL